jgi:type II secretory ATPase GspE/PulE/Tfp pilus assembly ATPase PilB-like protein
MASTPVFFNLRSTANKADAKPAPQFPAKPLRIGKPQLSPVEIQPSQATPAPEPSDRMQVIPVQNTIAQPRTWPDPQPPEPTDPSSKFDTSMEQALREEGVNESHIEILRRREAQTHEPITEIMRSSEYGFLPPEGVARVLARVTHLPYFSPNEIGTVAAADIVQTLHQLGLSMPAKFEGVLPVEILNHKGQQTLVLALSEPSKTLTSSQLFNGLPHVYKIASERTLSTLYRRHFSNSGEDTMSLLKQLSQVKVEAEQAQSLLRRFVLSLMRHACYAGASDIAFSPSASKSGGDVRLKIDGVGQLFTFLSTDIWNRVVTHLVTTCGAQDKLPLGPVDRRFVFAETDQEEFGEIAQRYGFRVILMQRNENENTLVTIVMRILDQQADTAELSTLGFDPETLRYIRDCKDRATGLFLVTGPTGSGKTTTLYATLNEIDPIARWVQSIENPIEYSRGLWMQFQTRQNAAKQEGRGGSDEAKGAHDLLKGLLRAAPDVILFGEIRKGDIAEQLVDAGNTGHLVFSTLHNNDAALAISRLRSFNLDMSAIASLLLGILAQRLIRTLCACATDDSRVETLTILANLSFLDENRTGKQIRPKRAMGCLNCNSTGFKGRCMVYELLRVTPRVRELIESGASPSQIAKEGIAEDRTLVGNALRLVAAGVTSIDEVKKLGPLKEGAKP